MKINGTSIALAKTKDFYIQLLKQELTYPLKSVKLKNDFNLTEEQLKEIYLLPHKVTKETRLRDMQYKTLNFLTNTNARLKTKKIKIDGTCNFCRDSPQTDYHLFFECKNVQTFWKNIERFWNFKTKENITFTLKDIYLGNPGFPNILNYILLLAKNTILKSLIRDTLPIFQTFYYSLREKFQVEKHIAYKYGKMKQFNKRWKLINPI